MPQNRTLIALNHTHEVDLNHRRQSGGIAPELFGLLVFVAPEETRRGEDGLGRLHRRFCRRDAQRPPLVI